MEHHSLGFKVSLQHMHELEKPAVIYWSSVACYKTSEFGKNVYHFETYVCFCSKVRGSLRSVHASTTRVDLSANLHFDSGAT